MTMLHEIISHFLAKYKIPSDQGHIDPSAVNKLWNVVP